MIVLAMKIAAVLLSGFFALALGANGQLANVHSVYVLPMSSGLDQHLANRITNAGLLQVVTDPAKADAVFTDHLGEAFEARLADLYPTPPAPKPQPVADKDKDKEEDKSDTPAGAKLKDTSAPRVSSFGRGKGTIFLVDPRSRAVLWSIYERPKDATAASLDRSAGHIVERLKHVLKGK
jgi:hypothetical protein